MSRPRLTLRPRGADRLDVDGLLTSPETRVVVCCGAGGVPYEPFSPPATPADEDAEAPERYGERASACAATECGEPPAAADDAPRSATVW